MRFFKKILLLIAVLFSVILSIAVYIYLERQAIVEPEVEEEFAIWVAAIDIESKTYITDEMLVALITKDAALYKDVIVEKGDIVGQYADAPIYKGEPFRKERLLQEIKDELSLNLAETFRAMSFNVSQASGVSDLIKVGDWVDLVVWLPEIKQDNRIIRPNIAKMVMQKVEVLAVNRQRERLDQYTEEIVPSYTLTLAVPVQEVERFVLSQAVGSIYVALRPYESDLLFRTPGVIWEDLLIDDFGRIKDLFPQYEIQGRQEPESDPIEIERYQYYTVLYGDTLRGISLKFYGTQDQYLLLKDVNQIEDENMIFPGMAIKIPITVPED